MSGRIGETPVSAPDVSGLEPESPAAVRFPVTPQGAFAAAAFFVSAIALAFSLGHRMARIEPPRQAERIAAATTETLDEARRKPPIRYRDLQIDRKP